MDEFEITLKNYRAFSQQAPITFQVSGGITFLLGVNNVGKSALLRAFFELKSFIMSGLFIHAYKQKASVRIESGLPSTFDRIVHRGAPSGPIEVRFAQNGSGWNMMILPIRPPDVHSTNCVAIVEAIGDPSDKFAELLQAVFKESLYVGSFRSTAVETTGALFDTQIGKSFVMQWDAWANGLRVDHNTQTEQLEEELRVLFGFAKLSISVSQHLSSHGRDPFRGPEEVATDTTYPEGALCKVTVNAYERNPKARAACLAHYGRRCSACGFDFEAVFGLGTNGIHVHHLRPLAEIRKGYEVDPIADLRPVCPNCHAVIHSRIPARSIDGVKKLRKSNHVRSTTR
jgi:hypothetical protein